jgi:AbrB family looped-hinge helix DNA binding protein
MDRAALCRPIRFRGAAHAVEYLPGITLEFAMGAVSVTSKGQVTIPKRVRQALGITAGSKVEFDVEKGGARLRLVKAGRASSVMDGMAILGYSGPRVPIERMHGGAAMKKAAKRARG